MLLGCARASADVAATCLSASLRRLPPRLSVHLLCSLRYLCARSVPTDTTPLLSPPTRPVQQTSAQRRRRSRANASPSATQARLVAEAQRIARARAVPQGNYIHAMPRRNKTLPMDEVPPKILDMGVDAVNFFRHYALPSDAYFGTYETDPYAALVSQACVPYAPLHPARLSSSTLVQAFFWARTMNWRFSDFREVDFASLAHNTTKPTCRLYGDTTSPLTTAASPYYACTATNPCSICIHGPCRLCDLENALLDEAGIDDADYSRFMPAYTERMDPAQPAVACGCCGVMDVPVAGLSGEASEEIGVLSFTEVALRSSTAVSQHTCRGKCSPDCPCFLAPLEYTSAELDAYNVAFPAHIIPSSELSGSALLQWQEEQHNDWLRFRRIKSNVGVDVHGTAVSRIGFGPQRLSSAPADPASAPPASLPVNPATLLHLYPELCSETPAATAPSAPPAATVTNICSPCMRALAERRRPDVSIANGWDLGTLSYADMPATSWAEKRAISKTRILCTALNIDLPRRSGTQGVHCVGVLYSHITCTPHCHVQGGTTRTRQTALLSLIAPQTRAALSCRAQHLRGGTRLCAYWGLTAP